MKQVKIIVERRRDGCVAHSVGIKGIVVGKEDTYEEALKNARFALGFHVEMLGPDVLENEDRPVMSDGLQPLRSQSGDITIAFGGRNDAVRRSVIQPRPQLPR